MSDIISSEELSAVRKLGYDDSVTYCKVFNWFRIRWGYVCWIEKTENKYCYKVYANGLYYRPKENTKYPYCKNYEEAQKQLLEELILIIKETEL